MGKRLEVVITGITKGLQSAFREAGDLAEGFGRRTKGAIDHIAPAVKLATVAAAGLGAATIGLGVSVAAGTEQARIGFTTLLGSAEKADAFVKDIKDFAAKTPFEFAGLQTASSQFLAVGLEANRVIPIMTTLGDATAALGTGEEGIARATRALTQMQQKGKVTSEEMLQLTEAGIPAWDALAAKLGVDVAKAQDMVTKRQVTANDMFVALETKAGPALQRVSGMMEKQSGSLAGMFSTFKDTALMGLGEAMTPLAMSLKEILPQITAGMESVFGVIADWGPTVGAALGTAFNGLVAFGGWLGDHRELMIGSLVAIGTVWVSVMGSAAVATLAATWPILAVGAAIAGLVAGLLWAYNNVTWFRDGVNAAFAWLQANVPPAIEAVRTTAMAVFGWLQANVLPTVAAVVGFVGEQFRNLATWTRDHWGQISAVIGFVVGAIQQVVGNGVAFVTFMWNTFGANILAYAQAIWGAVGGVIGAAMDGIRNTIEFFLNIVTGNWSGAWNNLLGIGRAVLDGMVSVVRGFAGAVMAVIGGLASWIGGIGSTMWNGLTSGFRSAWNSIAGFWNGLGFSLPGIDFGPIKIEGRRFDFPDLPRFHTGGVFRAPPGRREGLALLRDGERVSTDAGGRSAAQEVHVHVHAGTFVHEGDVGRYLAGALAEFLRGGGRLPAGLGG